MLPVFQKAIPVIEKIENAGYEAYFVGGAVRDWLMDRPIKDIDIATSATPMEIKQIFSQTVDLGIEHGTVLVLHQGCPYEVTTFRTESEYKDFRRPDEVHFIRSLKEDLQRRDFTMNAIAMNKVGQLIDPYDGQQAILDYQIKTVGKPEERFSEDALRMMRAIRFVSQFSFILEPSCYKALINLSSLLNFIAIERKTAEFEKILKGENRIGAIHLLYETNIFRSLPGLADSKHGLQRLTEFSCGQLMIDEMWGLLLYCLQLKTIEVEKFLRLWKLPVKRIKQIQAIYYWTLYRLEYNWGKRTLFDAGKENMVHVQRLYNVICNNEIDQTVDNWIDYYNSLPIKSRTDLLISGHDLMTLFNRKAGPWIKEYLALIEDAILEGELENQLDKIREWVLRCNLK